MRKWSTNGPKEFMHVYEVSKSVITPPHTEPHCPSFKNFHPQIGSTYMYIAVEKEFRKNIDMLYTYDTWIEAIPGKNITTITRSYEPSLKPLYRIN